MGSSSKHTSSDRWDGPLNAHGNNEILIFLLVFGSGTDSSLNGSE